MQLHIHVHLHQTQGESNQTTRSRRNSMGQGRRPGYPTETTRHWGGNQSEEEEEEKMGITMDDEEIAKNRLPLSALTLAKK